MQPEASSSPNAIATAERLRIMIFSFKTMSKYGLIRIKSTHWLTEISLLNRAMRRERALGRLRLCVGCAAKVGNAEVFRFVRPCPSPWLSNWLSKAGARMLIYARERLSHHLSRRQHGFKSRRGRLGFSRFRGP